MSEQEIKTFDPQLDKDLKTLFKLEDSGELASIGELVRDKALSKEVPAVRMGLRERRKKLLLDTTVDWDDVLFLAAGLVTLLAEQFERWESLQEGGQLELPDREEMSEKIGRLEASLKRVKKLAPSYGVKMASAGEQDESAGREDERAPS